MDVSHIEALAAVNRVRIPHKMAGSELSSDNIPTELIKMLGSQSCDVMGQKNTAVLADQLHEAAGQRNDFHATGHEAFCDVESQINGGHIVLWIFLVSRHCSAWI